MGRDRSRSRCRQADTFRAPAWLAAFNASSRYSQVRRDLRASVFKGTLQAIKDTGYTLPSENWGGWRVELSSSQIGSRERILLNPTPTATTTVSVKNFEPIEVAEELLLHKGYERVLVMNIANAYKPGGNVRGGGAGYNGEENLCRRTDLWQHLKTSPYPIPENGGILTKNVEVFRGPEKAGYPFLLVPFKVDVVSVGVKRLEKQKRLTLTEQGNLRGKIRWVLSTAMRARRESAADASFATVLGPFPEEVAHIFAEELRRVPYLGNVIFAIPEGEDSNKISESFRAVFGLL